MTTTIATHIPFGKYTIHVIHTDKLEKHIGDVVVDKFGDMHIFTENDGFEYGKTTTNCIILITQPVTVEYSKHPEVWYFDLLHNDKPYRKIENDVHTSTESVIMLTYGMELEHVDKLNSIQLQDILIVIKNHSNTVQIQEDTEAFSLMIEKIHTYPKIMQDIFAKANDIFKLQQEKNVLVKRQKYEQAANVRQQELDLFAELPNIEDLKILYNCLNRK